MRMGAWILALALVVMASAVMAIPDPTGASTTAGTAETATTTTATTQSVSAGTVLEVNVTATTLSNYWAGIYGQVNESVVIGSGSSIFYQWNITNPTGYVYLATHSDVNWAGITATLPTDAEVNADLSDAIAADAAWTPSADENVSATFATQDTTGTYCSIIGGYYVLTNSSNGTTSTAFWPTCIYKDNQATPRIVFEAKIFNDSNSFKATPADYQALVATPNSGAVTYYFYKG